MNRPDPGVLWAQLTGSGPADSIPSGVDLELFRALLDAVLDAGELQLGKLGQVGDVRSKSIDRDLVTEVDVACERLLVERLRAVVPSHAIEAEEEVHDAVRDGLRWFIDPLDGTVNYVHRLPLFGISAALYDGATPLLGVVHAPRLGETFLALAGRGAWLVDGPGAAQRLSVSRTTELGDAILGTGFPYRRSELRHSNLANFGRFFHDVRDLRRMGSAALDLAFVAAGRLDGFWELHLAPHDVAAGALLVREAGGVVTDADGGEDWLRGGHIVAAGAPLAALIRPRLEH
jgi:myo-inositol-1(or 4)-monophosphatase